MLKENESRADRAISQIDYWLGTNCWAAEPLAWNTRQHAIMKRKSFGEIALYIYLVNQLGGKCDPRLYDLIVQCVLGSDDYLDLPFRSPGKALLYGTPLLALQVSGDLPAGYLTRIDTLLTSSGVLGTERLPHRQLDLWHFMKAIGLRAPFDGLAASRFGLLEFPPSPILCNSDDAYGLTHNIFYISNFGVETDVFPRHSFSKATDLVRCLNGLSARVMAEGNIDLLLEIAICLLIVSKCRSPIVKIIIDHALDLFEKDGILNSPENSDVVEIGKDAPDQAHWFRSYHTMSVAAIAFRIFTNTPDDTATEVMSHRITKHEMLALGRVLHDLMGYKLLDAVSGMNQLGCAARHPDTAAIENDIFSFIADQRRPNGSYGYFSDEMRIWTRQGGDPQDFQAIQQEIDLAIHSVLASR